MHQRIIDRMRMTMRIVIMASYAGEGGKGVLLLCCNLRTANARGVIEILGLLREQESAKDGQALLKTYWTSTAERVYLVTGHSRGGLNSLRVRRG